jgi:hypothetical protein
MRLTLGILLGALAGGCSVLRQDAAPAVTQVQGPPAAGHEGVCAAPYPLAKYEAQCIAQAKGLAVRRGYELQLTFRNGTTRTYANTAGSQDCELSSFEQAQASYQGCKEYVLYDYFPEHDVLLLNVGYSGSGEWLLVRGQNGREEKIVAPPHYSPDRKWLASVEATDGPGDGNNGIDIVPASFDSTERAWHYRPNKYEAWKFVGWNGSDRLSLTVEWRARNQPDLVTSPAEVVHTSGGWHLNRSPPNAPRT